VTVQRQVPALRTSAGWSEDSWRSAIAIAIIGEQSLCLLLTLFVVPVAYSMVEDVRHWFARRKAAGPATPALPTSSAAGD